MTPRARGYHPPRQRREIVVAVLGVLAVLVITGIALWLIAPHDDTNDVTPSPPVTVPTGRTTTVPGGSVVTTTPTTGPGASTTAPGG